MFIVVMHVTIRALAKIGKGALPPLDPYAQTESATAIPLDFWRASFQTTNNACKNTIFVHVPCPCTRIDADV